MKTVLVVDDDRDVREVMSEALESEGYRVVTLVDGFEAIEWLGEARKTGATLPDVILLDLQMPRMGGAVVRGWLAEQPELCMIPVVTLSGEIPPLVPPVDETLHSGILRKPIALDTLLAVVSANTGPAE
jgi:CheY-like chemotaxis protein